MHHSHTRNANMSLKKALWPARKRTRYVVGLGPLVEARVDVVGVLDVGDTHFATVERHDQLTHCEVECGSERVSC